MRRLFYLLDKLNTEQRSDIERLAEREDEDQHDTYGSDISYHDREQLFVLEDSSLSLDLVYHLLGLHDKADKHAGEHSHHRHDNAVAYKVKSCEDIHTHRKHLIPHAEAKR